MPYFKLVRREILRNISVLNVRLDSLNYVCDRAAEALRIVTNVLGKRERNGDSAKIVNVGRKDLPTLIQGLAVIGSIVDLEIEV